MGSEQPSVEAALLYSRNYAEASPYLSKTAKEHILGLCKVLEATEAKRHTATTAAPTLFSADRQPPPDEEGFFTHPDFNAIFRHDEPSQDEVAERLALFGWEVEYVYGDDLLDDSSLDYDVRGWKPEPPAGDGWRLISVFDTEDGPYALFVRPQLSTAAAPQPEERKS